MFYQLIDPQSKLDFVFDWTEWLAEGDSIASHQWSVTPLNGTSPETPSLINPTNAVVTIAGCQAGKVYKLTDHIVTSAGLTEDRSIILRCDQR